MKRVICSFLSLLFIAILPILCMFLTAGSGQKTIWVQQDKYKPDLQNELYNVYKNKEIFLSYFTNKAEDTSIFYYYAKDQSIAYEGAPTLQSYLWYCFEKALISLNMLVYKSDYPIPDEVSELQLAFTSWSDNNFTCNITLFKYGHIIYQDEIMVTFEPAATNNLDDLEQRAYKQMDKIISTILGNKKVIDVFLKDDN